MTYPKPENESQRLEVLNSLNILDTAPDDYMDNICRTMKQIYGTRMVLVSLVAEHRQWFKVHLGLDAEETGRELAFCNYTIMSDEVFEVTNARENETFACNPLVTAEPHIRYYCGAPICVADVNIGSLCLIDTEPRPALSDDMKGALQGFAKMIAREISNRNMLKEAAGMAAMSLGQAG